MAKRVRSVNRWIRYIDVGLWIVGLVVIAYFAFTSRDAVWPGFQGLMTEIGSNRMARLNWRELLYIMAPLVTFAFTLITHWVDKGLCGGGIGQRADEIKRLHDLDTDVITGTMTKLSVLAALASIFIVFIQQDRKPTEADYYAVVRLLASVGFLISIFLMLVSVKTYDYTNRFNWEEHSNHIKGAEGDKSYYRVQLVGKAFTLDIFSFYFLLFSAILATGLIWPSFPIPASLLCGLLLSKSYFLKEKPQGLLRLKPHSVKLSVEDVNAVTDWYKTKLDFVADEKQAGLLEKNGFWIELALVDSASPRGVAQISFKVEDADSVARELKHRGVALVTEVKTDKSSGIKHFSVKDESGTHLRFIQDIK